MTLPHPVSRADPQFDFERGDLLLIDKPLTWTSFDVVNKVRRAGKFKKVGHAGTLDPLASGLLILATEKCTKLIDQIQGQTKEYRAFIKLGATTSSLDRETEEQDATPLPDGLSERIPEVIASFTGPQEQVPPVFSAIKRAGRPAYLDARKGVAEALPPRPIVIEQIEVLSVDLPLLEIRVLCSKGTYIRSLARDVATKLGVPGYLHGLTRTKIGEFDVRDGWDISHLAAALAQARA